MELPKVKTHIDGLDEVLGGGVPRGSVVLVSGLPGTMKSSLSYAMMANNAREDSARCLYVSLEQTRPSLENQMRAMGFDVDAVGGSIHVLDIGTIQKELGRSATKPWMDFLRRTIETKKKIDGVDLVAIDSLEALEVLARFEDPRTELFHFFEWLRDLGATALVLTEAPPEAVIPILEPSPPRDDAGYLADGIVHLKLHQITDVEMQRRIRIVKMRGANHKTGFYALLFEGGRFSVTPAMSS